MRRAGKVTSGVWIKRERPYERIQKVHKESVQRYGSQIKCKSSSNHRRAKGRTNAKRVTVTNDAAGDRTRSADDVVFLPESVFVGCAVVSVALRVAGLIDAVSVAPGAGVPSY